MAKISIVVPVYNSERYLGTCIQSLLSQTHDDLEVILVDDCSKDYSYDIMRTMQKENPRKIKIIRNEQNKGAGASRNLGLEQTEGKYICFLDSDDYLDLEALKKMHDLLEENGLDVARIGRKIIYKGHDVSFLGRKIDIEEGKIIVPSEELEYLTTETPAVTNKMFRKDLIGDRKFPERLKWEDYPFCIPLLYKANGVATVPDAEYYYRLNTSGTTVGDARKIPRKLLDIFACCDIIREDIPIETDEKLKERIDFLCIQNCLQRMRDIFYSNASIQEKKLLMSMLSALINKKYGRWQDNKLFQEYKKDRTIYRLRMDMIEHSFINGDLEALEEDELEYEMQKILRKKNR